jgi:hypothetical protein
MTPVNTLAWRTTHLPGRDFKTSNLPFKTGTLPPGYVAGANLTTKCMHITGVEVK